LSNVAASYLRIDCGAALFSRGARSVPWREAEPMGPSCSGLRTGSFRYRDYLRSTLVRSRHPQTIPFP
jgi:hypothetical protein